MKSYDLQYHIEILKKEESQLRIEVIELKESNNEELWDNSDMMRNWKISLRTLADWRAKGLIDYVQLGSKIWYTNENREAFLERNSVKVKAEKS